MDLGWLDLGGDCGRGAVQDGWPPAEPSRCGCGAVQRDSIRPGRSGVRCGMGWLAMARLRRGGVRLRCSGGSMWFDLVTERRRTATSPETRDSGRSLETAPVQPPLFSGTERQTHCTPDAPAGVEALPYFTATATAPPEASHTEPHRDRHRTTNRTATASATAARRLRQRELAVSAGEPSPPLQRVCPPLQLEPHVHHRGLLDEVVVGLFGSVGTISAARSMSLSDMTGRGRSAVVLAGSVGGSGGSGQLLSPPFVRPVL